MKSDTELESVLALAHPQQHHTVQKQSHPQQQQHLIASSSPYHLSDIAHIQVKSHHQQFPTSKNLKNGKEKSKRKDIFGANHQPHNHHHLAQETTTALAVVQQSSNSSTPTTTGAVIVNNSASIVRIPILDLQQVEKKKKKQLAPIITNLKNSHHHQQAIIMSSDNHHHNLREETASPTTLVVETKPKINQQYVNNNTTTNNLLNNNPTLMLRQTLTNSTVDNQSSSTVVRSGSVSSGLDIEEDSNNMNEQQFESPASTPRMFSPSSTLNFGDVMSPRESPHLPQPSGQLKQSENVIITPPILVQQEASHIVSEHETAVDLSSIETHETHDSEHTNVHSSKTSGSVNNSSPALVENNEGKRHSTRSRSNSAKSSQFNRPLERAHTAPNIITKKQGEKLPSKSSSRLSSKYGQSEYKTYIKHTLKLKEAGDMRVRGISLKYETNYHEFLEEAIPHKAFVSEMNLLNQFLKSNEPGTKYCCLGFTFFCCTFGLSMLPFAYQLSHFETAVRKYLDELNKKYASAHVSWKLVPSTTPSDDSYILVSLEKEIDAKDLEKLEIS